MAGDFWLQVTAQFNSLSPNSLSTIFENGITNQIAPLFGMFMEYGKLTSYVASDGNLIRLETSSVPLGTITTIEVRRNMGTCSMVIDERVVASSPCSNTALTPAPYSSNI